MSKTYYALSSLIHDNVEYKRGDAIDVLTDNVANGLLKEKVISRSKPELEEDFAPNPITEDEKLSSKDVLSGGGDAENSGEPSLDNEEKPATQPAKEEPKAPVAGDDSADDSDSSDENADDADKTSNANVDDSGAAKDLSNGL